jgi:hypothetical protein
MLGLSLGASPTFARSRLPALAAKLKEIISKHDLEIVSTENKEKSEKIKAPDTDRSDGAISPELRDNAGANSQIGDAQ